jgi:hypothetical protein
MKSGKKIVRKLLLVSDRPRVQARMIRSLGNGNLRSLILRLKRHILADDQASEQILAMAMCEAVRRFLERGRTIL